MKIPLERGYNGYMANIDFTTIVIVGAAISLLQQVIKQKSWSDNAKKASVIGLSLAASGAYIALKDSAFWDTFVSILASASTVYALVIKDLFPKE